MPITATPGSPNSDSFVTLAEAESYQANRLHNAAWASASDPDKEAALKWATRLLDNQKWVGRRVDEEQALRWPRYDVYDQDDFYVDSASIPQFLKNATSELAYLLVIADRTAESGTDGFKKIKVGSIELEIDSIDRIRPISSAVWNMIAPYVSSGFTLERG